jgi:hypothetical protein
MSIGIRSGLGQLAYQQRLGKARHTHQQRVPASKQADCQPFNRASLPDDDASKFGNQLVVRGSKLVDRLHIVVAQAVRGRNFRL